MMTTAITSSKALLRLCSALVLSTISAFAQTSTPKLFESRQVTPSGEYTFGIEGPAVDTGGNLFVVNIGKSGTIGRLAQGASQSEMFAQLPEGSVGVAIRFDAQGAMFVADYKAHTIFVFDKGSAEPRVFFSSDRFNQPNDMTIARDGTIYASDPNWKNRSGQIWRIARAADGTVTGDVMSAPRAMGTTNGIDLSPDGRTLYVGESLTGQVWSYAVNGSALTSARLVKTFEKDTIDGIRTDVDGRLWVTRILKGSIDVIAPDGKMVRQIRLQGQEPTNLAFGGPDGKTVFVTQRRGGYIESFGSDREGREHCVQMPNCRP